MNKSKIKELFELCNKGYEEDRKRQDIINKFFKIEYPTSCSPIIEYTKLGAYLEIIKTLDKTVFEIFEYYFYESPMIDGGGYYMFDDIKYTLNNFDEIYKIIEIYYEKNI